MFSSTSSSKTELKVVACVALVLFACELAIRWREDDLSLDLKHIRQIPEISQTLSHRDKTKVLFLGNSLTRNGVDKDVLEQEFAAQGIKPPQIERVFPDGTGIRAWYYVFNHYFVVKKQLPDIMIVSFASALLQDNQRLDTGQTARYFTSAADIPEVFRIDIHDFDGRVEYCLASGSVAFANRNRVRLRLLDSLIPDYRTTEQWMNESLKNKENRASQNVRPTYQRLEQFVHLAEANGVKVIVVAMPQKEHYTLDPGLQPVVESAGGTLIDARDVDGLTRADFMDQLHLNPTGATIYSRYLARQLVQKVLWPDNPSRPDDNRKSTSSRTAQ